MLKTASRRYRIRDLKPGVRVAGRCLSNGGRQRGISHEPARSSDPEQIDPNLTFTTLGRVPDLDNFVSPKGNCTTSSVEHSNPLNNVIMQPYAVTIMNELVDPDDLGNWILEDFTKDMPCLEVLLSQPDVSAIKPRFQQYQATHRLADGKKLEAEVRPGEVENVCTAVRSLAIERRDPQIRELIVIKCGPVPVTET